MIARLRAWLIELVREAMRLELGKYSVVMPSDFARMVTPKPAAPKPQTVTEPTFEQMQAESIAQQEKYYAPLNT